jgi:hypothetical protein
MSLVQKKDYQGASGGLTIAVAQDFAFIDDDDEMPSPGCEQLIYYQWA